MDRLDQKQGTGPLAARIALAAALAALSACTATPQLPDLDGISFRESRYEAVTAARDFEACRDEALELDAQARANGDAARYLASARLLERCQAKLGPNADTVKTDVRMRVAALAVQNYIKGGDAAAALGSLDRFKRAFPDRDLYYADGSSFRETMEVLLGQRDPTDFGLYATLNVSAPLKAEMRRVLYWKHN